MKMLTYTHFNSDPYFNMAFDEWMLQKVINEYSLICLRLYSWSVGTITFGFNQQHLKAFDTTKVAQTPVIRRVTGGRGLFHDESELTYSIAISSDLIDGKVVSESISSASSEIAKVLVQFLRRLNISSEYIKKSPDDEREKNFFLKAPCFASFSKNEIVADNKKIIASAQRRVYGALLQHGSIKINGFKHHDALQLNDVNYMENNEINSLTEESFEFYLRVFMRSFSEKFSTEPIQEKLAENELDDLELRKKLVKKNSLEKRDFIKQNKHR